MTPDKPALALWVLFTLSWWAASFWVARARSSAPWGRRAAYMAGFAIGFGALFLVRDPALGRLWRTPPPAGWLLVAGEIAAFGFGWWARLHLGRLWSGMLTLREGHRIVDTGPYGLARHPIYTAFIAAAWCYALIGARPASLLGALALTAVMTIKARDEERLLRGAFGAAAYDAYAARTPMLLPIPRRLNRPRATSGT